MISLGSPTGKAADAVAGQIQLRQLPGGFDAQILVKRPLNDAEQGLIVPGFGLHAAIQPTQGAAQGGLGPGVIAGIGRAFVKLHDDVAAQLLLNADGGFRGEEMPAAIQMGTEFHAVLGDLAQFRQGKHLGIRRNR